MSSPLEDPVGSLVLPRYRYVSRNTKPSALLNVTVALLSTKETVIFPSASPRGVPSAETDA